MDPWGHVTLPDLLTGAKARRQMRYQDNLQLTRMIAAAIAGKPEEIAKLMPRD
jgi:hypothetical protein